MSFWDSLPRLVIRLAPMDGATDAEFRKPVAEQGCPDALFTEFTHVNHICRGPDSWWRRFGTAESNERSLRNCPARTPCGVRARIRRACHQHGLSFAQRRLLGCGAGLIRTPALARAIIAPRGKVFWISRRDRRLSRLASGRRTRIY